MWSWTYSRLWSWTTRSWIFLLFNSKTLRVSFLHCVDNNTHHIILEFLLIISLYNVCMLVVQNLIALDVELFSEFLLLLSPFSLMLNLPFLLFHLVSVLHLHRFQVSLSFQLLVVFGFFSGTFKLFSDLRTQNFA